MIIGLSGVAQAGKDTVGQLLVDHYGFTRFAFADALKELYYNVDPLVTPHAHVSEIVDELGWEAAKTYPEVRRGLQRLGTEGGRSVLGENIWVDVLFSRLDRDENSNFVITDMRFPNEAEAISARDDGWTVRVVRESAGLAGVAGRHVSETALDGWKFDFCLDNNGTVEQLESRVDLMLSAMRALYC